MTSYTHKSLSYFENHNTMMLFKEKFDNETDQLNKQDQEIIDEINADYND